MLVVFRRCNLREWNSEQNREKWSRSEKHEIASHERPLNWIESQDELRSAEIAIFFDNQAQTYTQTNNRQVILIHSGCLFQNSRFSLDIGTRFLRCNVILQQPPTPPRCILQYMQLTRQKIIYEASEENCKRKEIIIFLDRLCRVPFRYFNLLWVFLLARVYDVNALSNNNKQKNKKRTEPGPRRKLDFTVLVVIRSQNLHISSWTFILDFEDIQYA